MTLAEGITRRIDVGGCALHVERHGHGTGDPVLVLHGFAGSTRAMAPIIAALAEDHEVLALDLIGHGRSDAPHEAAAYSWHAVTRQLVRALDALAIEHAHLFGFSLGGRVALQLAARHDHRVRSAVLVGCRCAWPEEDACDARRRSDAALAARIDVAGFAALAAPGADGDAIDAAAPRAGAHGLALALRGLGAADQPEVAAQLALSALPLCLIAGSNDAGPLAASRALASDLPCAHVVGIAGTGHRAHLERTDEVARHARGFYRAVETERQLPTEPRAQHAAGGPGERRW